MNNDYDVGDRIYIRFIRSFGKNVVNSTDNNVYVYKFGNSRKVNVADIRVPIDDELRDEIARNIQLQTTREIFKEK